MRNSETVLTLLPHIFKFNERPRDSGPRAFATHILDNWGCDRDCGRPISGSSQSTDRRGQMPQPKASSTTTLGFRASSPAQSSPNDDPASAGESPSQSTQPTISRAPVARARPISQTNSHHPRPQLSTTPQALILPQKVKEKAACGPLRAPGRASHTHLRLPHEEC